MESANEQSTVRRNLLEGDVRRKKNSFFSEGVNAFFQPKLTVGSSSDACEQQADDVADRIMRKPAETTVSPFFSPHSINLNASVHKKCMDCEHEEEISENAKDNSLSRKTIGDIPADMNPSEDDGQSVAKVQRKCAACEEEEKRIHRKETYDLTSIDTTSADNVLQTSGQPMDNNTRGFMEDRFGYDFSSVRIHNDARANQSSHDINALAYAHNDHIVFGHGQYQPGTDTGKKLLAHELTHVIQQKNVPAVNRSLQRTPDLVDEDPKIIKDPSKKNWARKGFLPFEFRANKTLEPPRKGVPNHPMMIWAISKIFSLSEDRAADVVRDGNIVWFGDSPRKENYLSGSLVNFQIEAATISKWIKILSADGSIDANAASVFEELIALQADLTHRDYAFFLEFMKRRGVATGSITDFKNLTPESLQKTKELIREFQMHKYTILDAYGMFKDYAVTTDVIRDARFEQLKDSLFNKDLKSITSAEREEVLHVFRDKALTTAFIALEEAKIIGKAEYDKYNADELLLKEVAEIITGYSGDLTKTLKTRIEQFIQFTDVYYDLIQVNPKELSDPANVSQFHTMKTLASMYESFGNNIDTLLSRNPRGRKEVFEVFSENNTLSLMGEALATALVPYAWRSTENLKRDHYLPEQINNPLFKKFREKIPTHGNFPFPDVHNKCVTIISELYPALTIASKADETTMKDMKAAALTKRHRVLLDVSIDFKALATQDVGTVKEKLKSTLKEKPGNADKTKTRLAAKPDLIWEFQPLLYHVMKQENLDKDHAMYKIVDAKIKAVADKSFWENMALMALGLVLGIAGIFTGGTTTALGITLLAGGAAVSLIDFVKTQNEYTIQSDAYGAIFKVPFVDEPSSLGVVMSLVGFVFDFAEVAKVFAKAAGTAAKAAKAGAKVSELDALAVALSQSKNIDQYSENLYEFLNKNKLLKSGVKKDVFIKSVKDNWAKNEKLIAGWKAREAMLGTLPTDVKSVINSTAFMDLPVEIRESTFKIFDADNEGFYKIIRTLSETPDKLKSIGFHVFNNPDMAKAYSQMSKALSSEDFGKVIRYYGSIGAHSADALPEVLNLMNKGKIFSDPGLALQMLTNRNVQQLMLHFRNTPDAMLSLWNDFIRKSANGDGSGFADFLAKDPAYKKFTKLEEASNPTPAVVGKSDRTGLLTDAAGKSPDPKAFEALDEDIAKLKTTVDDPSNIKDVTDAKYIDDYDVEVPVGNHTFRRNKTTGRWCRFSEEVCNLDLLDEIDTKVDAAKPPSRFSGTEAAGVEPRARGYAIEDLQLEYLEKGGWRGLPDYYPRIDFYRGGTLSKKAAKVKNIKNADVVSIKSTKITDPEALKLKVSEDIDKIKPAMFSNGKIAFSDINSKSLHLIFEQGFLSKVIDNPDVLKVLKQMKAKAKRLGISFEWFLVPADGSIRNGPVFMKEMKKVWDDLE